MNAITSFEANLSTRIRSNGLRVLAAARSGPNFFFAKRSRGVEQATVHAVAALAWVAVVVVVTGPRPCTSIIVVVVLATATNTSAQVGCCQVGWGGLGCQQGPQQPRTPHGAPSPLGGAPWLR